MLKKKKNNSQCFNQSGNLLSDITGNPEVGWATEDGQCFSDII